MATLYGGTINHWSSWVNYSTSTSNTALTLTISSFGVRSIEWGFSVTNVDSYVAVNGSAVLSVNDGGLRSSSGASATTTHWSGSHTLTFERGKSAYNVTLGVSATNNSGYMSGTSSNSITITVPALASYTVSYNANGGSGAPSSQTKWYGSNLTLSSTKPTRTGYTFQKWNTNASGTGTSYNSGATYSANAGVTLYAVWKANTYAVTYDANGGTGAPSNQTKTYGTDLTLSSTKPTRANYNFMGWGISATATTVSYASGAKYTTNAPITLYAVWELAYWVPKVDNFTVSRCNSSGTADDYGTYAKVEFSWETCQLLGTNNVSSIKIEWKTASATSYANSTTVSASGISGNVSKVIGSGALSTDSVYIVRVTITDSLGGTTDPTRTLSLAAFIMDILNGGGGIAFGKPAELDDTAEFEYNAKFNKLVDVHGQVLSSCGTHPQFEIANEDATATMFKANRTDVGVSVRFGVAADGVKHGVYSDKLGKWIAYADGSNVYVNNMQVSDTVVAQGTTGIWTYRKWASGLAECWGKQSKSLSFSTADMGGYASPSFSANLPSGLFNSIDSPAIVYGTTSNGGIVYYSSLDTSKITLTGLNSLKITNTLRWRAYITGKWK